MNDYEYKNVLVPKYRDAKILPTSGDFLESGLPSLTAQIPTK
jgi:hypothetical protein